MFEAAKRSQAAIDAAYREQRGGPVDAGRAAARVRLLAVCNGVIAALWLGLALDESSDRWLHLWMSLAFAAIAAYQARVWASRAKR